MSCHDTLILSVGLIPENELSLDAGIELDPRTRGADYVRQELIDPRRTISTSILVEGGELPLASVRLTSPIPKDRIMDAAAEIRRYKVTAPVKAGTVVIQNLFGLGSDVIVTKTVEAK